MTKRKEFLCSADRSCVRNPKWSGVCDDDVALDKAFRYGGWL